MKLSIILCIGLLAVLAFVKSVRSDFTCTACIAAITIIHNEVDKKEADIQHALDKVCDSIDDSIVRMGCRYAVDNYLDLVVQMIFKNETPTKVCNAIPIFKCHGCGLDPTKGRLSILAHKMMLQRNRPYQSFSTAKSQKFGSNLMPDIDVDHDKYGPIHPIIRGADWRGKDCDDTNDSIYPGTYDQNEKVDGNCNGIFGADSKGNKYEDLYCKDSQSRQIVTFGDSASSGFGIPSEWLKLENLTKLISALDELDHPQLSWSTGFDPSIGDQSIYLQMRKRNRCNHRAFQNVGHNGHEMKDLVDQVNAAQLKPTDKPILGFLAYIGNDVCKHNLDLMTTVEDYTKQLKAGLALLDSKVAPNSKVLISGLVDGRILWNLMWNQTHPLGASYAKVYDFLTCTNANTCVTYLNSNETVRNAAAKRAAQLSAAAQQVVAESKGQYKNLELDYLEFELEFALEWCKKNNVPPKLLVNQFDGFHPSIELTHRLLAKRNWEYLEKNHPDWIGPVNPHNAKIDELFGHQGGY